MTRLINRSVVIGLAVFVLFIAGAQAKSLDEQVRHELAMLPYYGVFDAIGFRVDGNVVTLSGAVHYPVLAQDAANVVKNIVGVAKVNNEIEVLPLSRFDDQLRLAAWRVVYSWPGMERLAQIPQPPVRILVKNGNVTLAGVVARQADKDALTLRVSTLPNVFSVTNDLVVEQKS